MATKYSKQSSRKVERAMDEMKHGTLRSGGSGRKVTNPKQAIAIGLSEARKEGARVPKPPARKKSGARATKSSAPRKAPAKSK